MIFEVMLLFLLLHQKQHTPDGNMVNFYLPVRTENQAEEPEQEALPELNHPPVEADSPGELYIPSPWFPAMPLGCSV
ncbi:TPA: hypothetical protein N6262_005231 [Escherichia coli]|nr:hypothetical protein [Escherichia coli]HCD2553158.1 hypothetical protein [Escherichia coli]HCJ6139654.1 hypothetical protein [Escherichia coli]HCN7542147.1 hypothetical protein [Escherichia coli]HCN9912256.1 hypothetical protein [Escherichia coli]